MPSPTRIITTRDVRRHVDEHVFAANGGHRVGIELEWITRAPARDRPPSPDEVRGLLDGRAPGRELASPSSPVARSSSAGPPAPTPPPPSRPWPPTSAAARDALTPGGDRAGRHRPRPGRPPRAGHRRPPLRGDGVLLRRALADGPHDDAQHRGRAGEPRPRRLRRRRPPLGARPRPRARARRRLRQLALRRHGRADRVAVDPTRRVARHRPPPHPPRRSSGHQRGDRVDARTRSTRR